MTKPHFEPKGRNRKNVLARLNFKKRKNARGNSQRHRTPLKEHDEQLVRRKRRRMKKPVSKRKGRSKKNVLARLNFKKRRNARGNSQRHRTLLKEPDEQLVRRKGRR